MQGKSDPADADIVIDPDVVDTPGNEVTPRSDEIRKNFQHWWFGNDGHAKKKGSKQFAPQTEERVKGED